MPAPFKVKAVYEYRSQEPDDLNFDLGQIITVTDDQEEDWYTGEFVNATTGGKADGMFPRNFVEKYEPAIPSRPARTPKRPAAPEPAVDELTPPKAVEPEPTPEPEPKGAEIEPPQSEIPASSVPSQEPIITSSPPAPKPAPAAAVAAKAPPPVAEKSSSFKDRIAAFNKTAAPPIAPFKPGGQGTSTGFIKKPFVALPPSKNSYVPPPREQPAPKIYRREEDPEMQQETSQPAPEPPRPMEEPTQDDQPKPTSLKERIALLQKQQQEQASRHAEAVQRKEKPKKPPKKRVESAEQAEAGAVEPELQRLETNETLGRKSIDAPEDESEIARPQVVRQLSSDPTATPLQPSRELVSDTNDADDSGAADTEDAQEISTEEERPRSKGTGITPQMAPPAPQKEQKQAPVADDEEEEGEEEDTEEEEEDPELRRKRELRERMAKMSGGMGMMGMFGGGMPAAGPAPRKPRVSTEADRQSSENQAQEEAARAPPVPIMALPGMGNNMPKRKEEPVEADSDEEDTALPTPREPARETTATAAADYIAQPPRRTSTNASSRSIPQGNAPLPPQREARAAPPPPPEVRSVPAPPQSPGARPVPPPPPPTARPAEEIPQTPDSEADEPITTVNSKVQHEQPSSPIGAPPVPSAGSRPPPPRDGPMSPVGSPQSRPPPPPPPGQPPSRRTTGSSLAPMAATPDEESEDEVTEYDGDYDTDIASSAKHKDALKSHNRDSSIDEGLITDDAAKSPVSPPARTVPPLPPAAAPRDVAPPPRTQVPPKSRKSTDAPRAAPPPVPSLQMTDEEEYDPYRYAAPQHGLPSPPIMAPQSSFYSPHEEVEEPQMYEGSSQPPRMPSMPPMMSGAAGLEPNRPPLDVKRSNTLSRRSVEQARPSGEHGLMATDFDLGQASLWWTQENLPPPSLRNRSDILYEMETSSNPRRSGNTEIRKEIYVLYQDHSQTTISATYDSTNPGQALLEQSHERPPPAPRRDQLELASENFGKRIASSASQASSSGSTVGDGSAHAFINALLQPLSAILPPVGHRAYGALVYANLANASTQQFDEIRPGDIVTFRNAKFSGHKGGLHQKYNMEAGKPDHVGVVMEWDGTKKKIRCLEQGRDAEGPKKRSKVREEGYRVGDLRSGEVRVWRVMGREWVGWDKS